MNKNYRSFLVVGIQLVLLSALAGCGGGGGGGSDAPSSASAGFFANWSCGGSGQCAVVMGGPSGSQPFSTLPACQSWCATYIPGNCSCSTIASSGTTTLSSVLDILNGPNAAGQTSYWHVNNLGYNGIGGFTKLALFADGTGMLIAGTNNCQIPVQPATVTNNAPVVQNFTWNATGPSALTFTNATYHCTFDVNPDHPAVGLISENGPLTSMSSISGGISTATLHATVVDDSTGSYTGSLVAGTF